MRFAKGTVRNGATSRLRRGLGLRGQSVIAWLIKHRDPILIGLVVSLLAALILWLVGVLGDVFRGGPETRNGTVSQVERATKTSVQIDTSASRFHPGDGKDPAREYVCLVNKTGRSVDLLGWVLRDRTREVNKLPAHSLPPHGHI